MIAVDTNVLVYAHREGAPQHARALEWLEHLSGSPAPWGVPLFCLGEFLRVVTHPRLFDPPSTLEEACGAIEALLECESLQVLYPERGYPTTLLDTVREAKVRGNLIFDAQIVALCREHGVRRLLSEDADFARFAGIERVGLDAELD